MKFSDDGTILASSGAAGEVKLWHAQTFEIMNDLTGHQDSVSAIAISPDNKRVVTGSDDYTIRFWDIQSGLAVLTLRGSPDQLFHAMFSDDGSSLLMAEKHGTIRFLRRK